MNSKNLTSAFLATVAFGAFAHAQAPSRHVGTLVQVGNDYTLAELHNPGIRLQSTFNLDEFVDEVVDLSGSLQSSFTGTGQNFQVATIGLADRAFSSDDVGVLGSFARMRVDAVGTANFFVHVSLGYGYLPLTTYGPTVAGAFWLDPSIVLSVAGGAMIDRWRGNLFVPNDPFFLGLTLYFQAAVHEPGQPLLFLNSNPMTFTNAPF
jgi:hypothetical protein